MVYGITNNWKSIFLSFNPHNNGEEGMNRPTFYSTSEKVKYLTRGHIVLGTSLKIELRYLTVGQGSFHDGASGCFQETTSVDAQEMPHRRWLFLF